MPTRSLVIIALLMTLPACTGVRRFAYEPRPTSVAMTAPNGNGAARVALSVTEVREPEASPPRVIEVRSRIENTGRSYVDFDPASLRLLAGNLTPFPDPFLDYAQPVTLSPGEEYATTAWFPFPPEEVVDLAGLEVAWALGFDGTEVSGAAVLKRHRPAHRRSRSRFHFGYGYSHHYHLGWFGYGYGSPYWYCD